MARVSDPEDRNARTLACAVLWLAVKDLRGNMRDCRRFFESCDYRFWAGLAGIDVDGPTMAKAVGNMEDEFRYLFNLDTDIVKEV